MSIGKEFMSSFGEEIRVLPRRAFWRKTRCQFWKDKEKIQRCQLCMDRMFPSWFGAGAVLEGEIGAEPSLRRPAGALERICMCAASCAVKSCSSFLVMEILKSRTACCKSAWLRSPGQVWKEVLLPSCMEINVYGKKVPLRSMLSSSRLGLVFMLLPSVRAWRVWKFSAVQVC